MPSLSRSRASRPRSCPLYCLLVCSHLRSPLCFLVCSVAAAERRLTGRSQTWRREKRKPKHDHRHTSATTREHSGSRAQQRRLPTHTAPRRTDAAPTTAHCTPQPPANMEPIADREQRQVSAIGTRSYESVCSGEVRSCVQFGVRRPHRICLLSRAAVAVRRGSSLVSVSRSLSLSRSALLRRM